MLDNVSIIYNTCDKYESLWPGFFTLFKKYWKDCSNTIILNTEEKTFHMDGLQIVRPDKSGTACSWSQRLINSLDIVTTPYVVMILDDFYLKSPVNLEKLERCVNRMELDKSIQLFTFAWQPGSNKTDTEDPDFERRARFAPYRINAQIALWRVDYLRKIIRSYENPWQFEISGSFRSSIYGGKLYALKKEAPLVFDYDWGFLIIRGKVNEKVADYFKHHEGLPMDLPFEKFTQNDDQTKRNGRIGRLIKYGSEMMVSLFRK